MQDLHHQPYPQGSKHPNSIYLGPKVPTQPKYIRFGYMDPYGIRIFVFFISKFPQGFGGARRLGLKASGLNGLAVCGVGWW